jgi:hypothetical protein
MSYDVYLTIDTGGPEHALVTGGRNMTSNVAQMWRLAGADIAEFHGRIAADCVPLLRAAIADMEDHPGRFRPLNPANGWGSYETCLEFLRELLGDFVQHPKATVAVSR